MTTSRAVDPVIPPIYIYVYIYIYYKTNWLYKPTELSRAFDPVWSIFTGDGASAKIGRLAPAKSWNNHECYHFKRLGTPKYDSWMFLVVSNKNMFCQFCLSLTYSTSEVARGGFWCQGAAVWDSKDHAEWLLSPTNMARWYQMIARFFYPNQVITNKSWNHLSSVQKTLLLNDNKLPGLLIILPNSFFWLQHITTMIIQ